MLEESRGPLLDSHDLVMFDLDGVVYVGGEAISGVAGRLERVRSAGARIAFVTNNASRTSEAVATHLTRLGIRADPGDVVTSAQAAARVLLDRFGPGAQVLMLGGEGLRVALEEEGLVPRTDPEGAVALASGYGPDVRWRDIMRCAVLVRDGLPYVASNTDHTIPTAYGLAPGHGVLVKAISDFAGIQPVVAGKPARPLMDETIRRVGGARPLMVGDRLDTDIEGAHEVGVDSLLVMTGVTHVAELVAAGPRLRPSWIAPDLEGLFESHPVPLLTEGGARLGGWHADVEGGALRLGGAGSLGDWWRVVAASAWAYLDATGQVVDATGVAPPLPGGHDGRR